MITTANIYKAIRTRLENNFREVTIIKDLKNSVEPCFYIEYLNTTEQEVANDTVLTRTSFDIIYFSAAKTLIDLTEIESKLRHFFKKPLKVIYKENNQDKKKYLHAVNLQSDFDETDYYIEFEVSYEFYQQYAVKDKSHENDDYETGEYDNEYYMEFLEF